MKALFYIQDLKEKRNPAIVSAGKVQVNMLNAIGFLLLVSEGIKYSE